MKRFHCLTREEGKMGNCHLSSPQCKTVKIGLDQWIYLTYLSSFPVYISSQNYSKRNIFWTSTLSCQGNTGLTGLTGTTGQLSFYPFMG